METITLNSSVNTLMANNYIFDGNIIKDTAVSFTIEPAQLVTILFLNISSDINIKFYVKHGSYVRLSFLQTKPINMNIVGALEKEANVTCYYADFVKGNISLTSNIDLIGENAVCLWNLASLAKEEDKKNFDVSIYHKSIKTNCEINNYGVARDYSKLVFSGICKIENGAHESKAHQNSKIMVFDEASDAIAKPILKIDDNDIEASHAAVVGKISDDHMFYLTSRGLSLKEARELITYGYLKPILAGFNDKALQEEINSLIEKGL